MDSNARPYGSLYFESIQELMSQLTFPAFRVFMALFRHVSPIGTCDPGDQRLAGMCKLSPGSVPGAIDELESLGYAKRMRVYDPIRFRERTGYVLNPCIIAVNPDYFEDAWKVWTGHDGHYEINAERNVIQVTPKKNQNKHQKATPVEVPPTTPTKYTAPVNVKTANPSVSNGNGNGKNGEQYKNGKKPESRFDNAEGMDSEAHSKAESPQPPPTPPVPPPDGGNLATYAAELPDATAESLAQRAYAVVPGLAVRKARQLVDVFGVTMVDTALTHYGRQSGLRNPSGWLIAILRRGGVDPADVDKPNVYERTGNDYLTGEYGAYIQH